MKALSIPLALSTLFAPLFAAEPALLYPPNSDARFNWASYAAFEAQNGGLAGQSLTIDGPWGGVDKALFESVIAYFEAATGVAVDYAGGDGFESRLMVDVAAGAPPNLAVIPQPGLAADLAARGKLAPLPEATADWLRGTYAAGQSWVDLATYAGPDGLPALYGLFYKVEVKSLVWYSPENFADMGYAVPRSMEELRALEAQIIADGGTPWCIGLGSGPATGWPATDWVEDLMLRLYPVADYDAWLRNDLRFDDPKVIAAIEAFGAFAKVEANVAGGAGAVGATDFRDSAKGLFSVPPACYLHHQASFIPSFFPEGTELGAEADFFYFPAYAEKNLGNPVLGAGTLIAITQDSPAARSFIAFLQTPLAHEIWMSQSGFLTPHKGVNPQLYVDATQQKLGDILLGASTFRFDGSDMMPGAVGAGSFWTGMVDFTNGQDAARVARAIQASWDALNE